MLKHLLTFYVGGCIGFYPMVTVMGGEIVDIFRWPLFYYYMIEGMTL